MLPRVLGTESPSGERRIVVVALSLLTPARVADRQGHPVDADPW